jgi:hypothetical protein
LVFWNSSFLLINDYSIHGLCVTFWTNEFLGSYSNYKFIISFSFFNRMGLWRTLYLQSYFEEVLSFSFSIPISSYYKIGIILILQIILFPLIIRLVLFLLSFHQEVASDSFCFLINSFWLLTFMLYVFSLFFSGFNLYWWKGIHFS